MKKPVLIIMAAGMGSRYGGLKQIDPVDEDGHIIMDFSIYDAVKAGFEKVIFIIKKENEQDFRETIGDRMAQRIEVEYVFQDIANLPEGFAVSRLRADYKRQARMGDVLYPLVEQGDGVCRVALCDAEGKPFEITEFMQKRGSER